MAGPDWLTALPIAHRGLHDAATGFVENTAGAVVAAIAGGYGFEIDVQITADGEAMVHHDHALGRLTDGEGRLADMTAAALKRIPFRGTEERMIGFGELCDLVAGRATMLVELKAGRRGDRRLADRVAAILASYRGPVGVMSFSPDLIGMFRAAAPGVLRGIVSQRRFETAPGGPLAAFRHYAAAHILHAPATRPQFLAYRVDDLPAPATSIARKLALPVLTWTVRTPAQRQRAADHADQMIFEGFHPLSSKAGTAH